MPATGANTASRQTLRIRQLGQRDYSPVWQAMQDFTQQRNSHTLDEIWLVEHPRVFTLGLNGKHQHILNAGDIPIVKSDRGGQVTYHGPGQLVVYLMIDLQRQGLGVRALVTLIEQSIIALLADHNIEAISRKDAPGVYVNGAKIAALGLRIKRGYSYHGLSLNIDMDLEPFSRINPCGYPDMPITQLTHLGIKTKLPTVAQSLLTHITAHLGYHQVVSAADENLFIDG